MPGCSESILPNGVKVKFVEDTHKYSSIIDNKELEYVSVTTLIGKYYDPFDADKIAPFSARKLGKTVEEVKEMWKQSGAEACRFGTRTHEICEDTIRGLSPRNIAESQKEECVFKHAVSMAMKLKESIDIIAPEKMIADSDLGIAGTIDLLGKSRKDGSYLIIDWKTNKEIDTENKYGERMRAPVSHLENTAFSHYSLQLNLYQYLLKHAGYVDKNAKFKMALVHLTMDEPKLIMLPDMQSEVKDILIDFYSKIVFNKKQ